MAAAEAKGYSVSAPDLPGHGEQPALRGAVVARLARLCEPGIALRGSSFGAYLALHLAAAPDVGVGAVVAIAPTSEKVILERYRAWDARIDAKAFESWLRRRDVHEAVTRIRCPVLYVIARDDERISVRDVERLHELTPRSELVILECGGHAGPSHDPGVHELTLSWLDGALAGPNIGGGGLCPPERHRGKRA